MRYRIIIITALVFSLNILQAIGQNRSFVYPVMPDSLKSVEQRLNYLGLHYWDNFDFKDTLQLSNANISEQGFVNFIDLIPHFTPSRVCISLLQKLLGARRVKTNSRASSNTIWVIRSRL